MGIVKRSDKVAFFGVKTENGTVFHRMKGFTEISVNRNPKEYARQYVDEAFERTDVVGYATAISYRFDQHREDAVHQDFVSVHDSELLGSDAVRDIVIVDFSKGSVGPCPAKMRAFSVIPDSEGTSKDAYTYSGTLKTAGDTVSGTATSEDDWETLVFAEAE